MRRRVTRRRTRFQTLHNALKNSKKLLNGCGAVAFNFSIYLCSVLYMCSVIYVFLTVTSSTYCFPFHIALLKLMLKWASSVALSVTAKENIKVYKLRLLHMYGNIMIVFGSFF